MATDSVDNGCVKCGIDHMAAYLKDESVEICQNCGNAICTKCCVYTDSRPQQTCCCWDCADALEAPND